MACCRKQIEDLQEEDEEEFCYRVDVSGVDRFARARSICGRVCSRRAVLQAVCRFESATPVGGRRVLTSEEGDGGGVGDETLRGAGFSSRAVF